MTEQEPSPSGFRVEIENPEGIYEQVRTPTHQWTLGAAPLEDPLDGINVSIHSDGKVFEVVGFVRIKETNGSKARIVLDEGTISGKLGTKKVGDKLFILGDDGKPKYEIFLESNFLNQVFVAETNSPVGPRPVGDFEGFKKELERLARITELVVNSIYKGSGKETPDVTLIFRPPRRVGPENFTETSRLRDIVRERVSVERPRIIFEEIGGQHEAKKEIQGLAFALTHPELYKKWGTKPPKGILLTGPPGNGKTLLARALASEAQARFFHVEVSDVVSKWYGEAEQLMKAIFEEAGKGNEKTIIFFDELDAIAPHRGESHEASAKIVTTMLENMDGLEAKQNILVVAATNRPEAIDSALLRPGRFDRIVDVPLPDREARKEILLIHMQKAEKMAERKLFGDLETQEIVQKTEGFSGADLAEVVRRTLEEKVRLEGSGQEPGLVTGDELLKTIENYEQVRKTKRKLGLVKN